MLRPPLVTSSKQAHARARSSSSKQVRRGLMRGIRAFSPALAEAGRSVSGDHCRKRSWKGMNALIGRGRSDAFPGAASSFRGAGSVGYCSGHKRWVTLLPGVGTSKESPAMRLIAIVLAASALVFASGAIAQTTSDKADKQTASQQESAVSEHPGWYTENAPYRPCPVVATINGRDVCLGCPGRCPWPPTFARTTDNKGDKRTEAEYREKGPYKPCPTVAAINGHNVCLGCPGRCPGSPSFGK